MEDHNWHDSGLRGIGVRYVSDDRREVELHLDYVESYETMATSPRTLRFGDCFGFRADLYVGLIAHESLASIEIVDDSPWIAEWNATLGAKGMAVPDGQVHYRITLNSSGSRIDVLAASAVLEPVTD